MSYRARKESDMNYDDEIKNGRRVRVWMGKSQTPEKGFNGTCIYSEPNPGSCITQEALLILPPKPLEVTGYVCDYEPDLVSVDPLCFSQEDCTQNKREINCRPVTLVEKEAK